MARRCSTSGLMLAGLIVFLIGLALALRASLDIPSYWTPVLVGAALFLVGAVRRLAAGDHEGPRRDGGAPVSR